jgi:methionyl-tRNA formyltransferase
MRAVFIGAVDTSVVLLDALLKTPAEVVCVITVDSDTGRRRHSDFADLEPTAQRSGIPVFRPRDLNTDGLDILRSFSADVLLTWGWSRLVGAPALATARLGGIGFHPAPLPLGRGRHPLVWSILLGLRTSAVSFFRLSDGADDGDILLQRPFKIGDDETASSLLRKVAAVGAEAVPDLVRTISVNGLKGTPQSGMGVVTWRKRSETDGRLDFRMPASGIDRLVRALSKPYPGAHAILSNGRSAKIWRVRVVERAPTARYAEPGRIYALEAGNLPVVACGDESVTIVDHEFDPGDLRTGAWFC